MAIYLVLVAVLVVLAPLDFIKLPEKFNKKWKRIIEITLPILIMFVISAFKSVNIGFDTIAYYEAYKGITTNHFEPLFKAIMKVFSLCKMPFFVFLVFCYLIIYGSLWLLLYKKSEYPILSLVVYLGFSFFVFGISGLRQSVAMGVTIFAFLILDAKPIKKKFVNYIIFAVLTLIAFLIHNSAFIIVAIPFLLFLKIEKKWLLIICPIILFLLYFLADYIFEFVFFYLVSGDTYAPGSFGGGGTVWLYILILIALVVFNDSNKFTDSINNGLFRFERKINKKNRDCAILEPTLDQDNKLLIQKLATLFLAAIFFQSFTRVNINFPRFGFYFSIFLPIALSSLISVQKSKTLRIIFYVGIFAFYLFCYFKNYLLIDALGTSHFSFGPIM